MPNELGEGGKGNQDHLPLFREYDFGEVHRHHGTSTYGASTSTHDHDRTSAHEDFYRREDPSIHWTGTPWVMSEREEEPALSSFSFLPGGSWGSSFDEDARVQLEQDSDLLSTSTSTRFKNVFKDPPAPSATLGRYEEQTYLPLPLEDMLANPHLQRILARMQGRNLLFPLTGALRGEEKEHGTTTAGSPAAASSTTSASQRTTTPELLRPAVGPAPHQVDLSNVKLQPLNFRRMDGVVEPGRLGGEVVDHHEADGEEGPEQEPPYKPYEICCGDPFPHEIPYDYETLFDDSENDVHLPLPAAAPVTAPASEVVEPGRLGREVVDHHEAEERREQEPPYKPYEICCGDPFPHEIPFDYETLFDDLESDVQLPLPAAAPVTAPASEGKKQEVVVSNVVDQPVWSINTKSIQLRPVNFSKPVSKIKNPFLMETGRRSTTDQNLAVDQARNSEQDYENFFWSDVHWFRKLGKERVQESTSEGMLLQLGGTSTRADGTPRSSTGFPLDGDLEMDQSRRSKLKLGPRLALRMHQWATGEIGKIVEWWESRLLPSISRTSSTAKWKSSASSSRVGTTTTPHELQRQTRVRNILAFQADPGLQQLKRLVNAARTQLFVLRLYHEDEDFLFSKLQQVLADFEDQLKMLNYDEHHEDLVDGAHTASRDFLSLSVLQSRLSLAMISIDEVAADVQFLRLWLLPNIIVADGEGQMTSHGSKATAALVQERAEEEQPRGQQPRDEINSTRMMLKPAGPRERRGALFRHWRNVNFSAFLDAATSRSSTSPSSSAAGSDDAPPGRSGTNIHSPAWSRPQEKKAGSGAPPLDEHPARFTHEKIYPSTRASLLDDLNANSDLSSTASQCFPNCSKNEAPRKYQAEGETTETTSAQDFYSTLFGKKKNKHRDGDDDEVCSSFHIPSSSSFATTAAGSSILNTGGRVQNYFYLEEDSIARFVSNLWRLNRSDGERARATRRPGGADDSTTTVVDEEEDDDKVCRDHDEDIFSGKDSLMSCSSFDEVDHYNHDEDGDEDLRLETAFRLFLDSMSATDERTGAAELLETGKIIAAGFDAAEDQDRAEDSFSYFQMPEDQVLKLTSNLQQLNLSTTSSTTSANLQKAEDVVSSVSAAAADKKSNFPNLVQPTVSTGGGNGANRRPLLGGLQSRGPLQGKINYGITVAAPQTTSLYNRAAGRPLFAGGETSQMTQNPFFVRPTALQGPHFRWTSAETTSPVKISREQDEALSTMRRTSLFPEEEQLVQEEPPVLEVEQQDENPFLRKGKRDAEMKQEAARKKHEVQKTEHERDLLVSGSAVTIKPNANSTAAPSPSPLIGFDPESCTTVSMIKATEHGMTKLVPFRGGCRPYGWREQEQLQGDSAAAATGVKEQKPSPSEGIHTAGGDTSRTTKDHNEQKRDKSLQGAKKFASSAVAPPPAPSHKVWNYLDAPHSAHHRLFTEKTSDADQQGKATGAGQQQEQKDDIKVETAFLPLPGVVSPSQQLSIVGTGTSSVLTGGDPTGSTASVMRKTLLDQRSSTDGPPAIYNSQIQPLEAQLAQHPQQQQQLSVVGAGKFRSEKTTPSEKTSSASTTQPVSPPYYNLREDSGKEDRVQQEKIAFAERPVVRGQEGRLLQNVLNSVEDDMLGTRSVRDLNLVPGQNVSTFAAGGLSAPSSSSALQNPERAFLNLTKDMPLEDVEGLFHPRGPADQRVQGEHDSQAFVNSNGDNSPRKNSMPAEPESTSRTAGRPKDPEVVPQNPSAPKDPEPPKNFYPSSSSPTGPKFEIYSGGGQTNKLPVYDHHPSPPTTPHFRMPEVEPPLLQQVKNKPGTSPTPNTKKPLHAARVQPTPEEIKRRSGKVKDQLARELLELNLDTTTTSTNIKDKAARQEAEVLVDKQTRREQQDKQREYYERTRAQRPVMRQSETVKELQELFPMNEVGARREEILQQTLDQALESRLLVEDKATQDLYLRRPAELTALLTPAQLRAGVQEGSKASAAFYTEARAARPKDQHDEPPRTGATRRGQPTRGGPSGEVAPSTSSRLIYAVRSHPVPPTIEIPEPVIVTTAPSSSSTREQALGGTRTKEGEAKSSGLPASRRAASTSFKADQMAHEDERVASASGDVDFYLNRITNNYRLPPKNKGASATISGEKKAGKTAAAGARGPETTRPDLYNDGSSTAGRLHMNKATVAASRSTTNPAAVLLQTAATKAGTGTQQHGVRTFSDGGATGQRQVRQDEKPRELQQKDEIDALLARHEEVKKVLLASEEDFATSAGAAAADAADAAMPHFQNGQGGASRAEEVEQLRSSSSRKQVQEQLASELDQFFLQHPEHRNTLPISSTYEQDGRTSSKAQQKSKPVTVPEKFPDFDLDRTGLDGLDQDDRFQ
ncbi:unnamed protein product [Amoebophrya sp. A120]|nr:unnamed protein product [Amoebophrya sp. A120]|eukprot:GSA120T00013271001.1